MSIFDKDRVGVVVHCRIAKNGTEQVALIKWTQASVGNLVKIHEYEFNKVSGRCSGYKITTGWEVLEVDVPAPDMGLPIAVR